MVKSMGELKKVVVSKVANNAAENRGNKRKYWFFSSFLHIYFVNAAAFSSSCCTSDFILNIICVFLTQIDWRIN